MESKHKCALDKPDARLKWSQRLRLISPDNPLSLNKFRSEVAIRDEQERHLRINRYAIHPFSMFRIWYEIYLIYLYGSVLITKPIDAGFMKISLEDHMPNFRFYTIATDVLCWVDIVVNFFTGVDNGSKVVELRRWYIAAHYVFRSYFIFDALSSIPKSLLYYLPGIWNNYRFATGIIGICNLLKIVRIICFIKYTKKISKYLLITSQGMQFLLCSVLTFMLTVHWMACLQFAVPRFVRRSFSSAPTNNSWFFDHTHQSLYGQSVGLQYVHCLFKSSAYILGIRIDIYKMALPEEYLLAIITYFIGKILIAFIWIILAVAILNSRVTNIKFLEIMNQLEEYMRQKQLPLGLRDRIRHYFNFKFGNKFFQERMVNGLLSENLKRDAAMHICKSLVKNVSLFQDLTPLQISKIVNYLTPEIYQPNDIIVRAGTYGNVMYFISSGTVAVYTRSGKEVCHLQDGAYFGEIALVLKNNLRTANIVALETSQIYKLNKKDLEKCLLINKTIRRSILREADERLKMITKLEEEYKEQLFEQAFRNVERN